MTKPQECWGDDDDFGSHFEGDFGRVAATMSLPIAFVPRVAEQENGGFEPHPPISEELFHMLEQEGDSS